MISHPTGDQARSSSALGQEPLWGGWEGQDLLVLAVGWSGQPCWQVLPRCLHRGQAYKGSQSTPQSHP